MGLVGKGTGFQGALACESVKLRRGGRELRLPFHASYVVDGYPACAKDKFGSVVLGSSAATLDVALSKDAKGWAIKKYPIHVLVTSSAPLTGNKVAIIRGLDFYGRPNSSEFVITDGSGWYSPGDFSQIDYIAVEDDGLNSGVTVRFGDAAPGETAGCPLFSLPQPIIELIVNDEYHRTSSTDEWVSSSPRTNSLHYPRDRANGVNRGGYRFSNEHGEPDGSMGYMIRYDVVKLDGDPV